MTDSEKLDELLIILKRVEAREIKTTAMVSEIEEAAPPLVGSFASTDYGKEKKD